VALLVAGGVASIFLYREGKAHEREDAEADFAHHASLQHALTREILGHFEDALFGLSALFRSDDTVSHDDFMRATARLKTRIEGAHGFEWVQFVPHEARGALEAALGRTYAPRAFEITETAPDGKLRRAADRPVYFPIIYIQPLSGNEPALGYDLMTGVTWKVLERSRDTRQMMVTPQIRLVQEAGDKFGVVMAWPIYRPKPSPAGSESANPAAEEFAGFLQCVFRLHELLETVHRRQPDTIVDMLFLDRSETDPARRTLYYRPALGEPAAGTVAESDFRRGVTREFKIPFGQRDWRVVFRPRAGWLEEHESSMPLLRSCSVMLLATLMASLVHLFGRRTDSIKREVNERTAELVESRRQMASMLHALPGMSFRCTYDDELSVLFVSEGALALTGWTAEEFTSGRVHFRACIHPDDLSRVREVTRNALQEQKDFEVEYRIRMKSGDEKWVLSRGRGAFDAAGSHGIVEGLAIDITAQKQAEAARLHLERKLLEGQKLESLGLLAGGIAHDFNNLLSAFLGSASMARISLAPGDPTEGQLRMIESASMRAAELCRQMLAYAGKGPLVIEPTDLSLVIEEMMPLLQGSIVRHAELKLVLARDLPLVRADATQIRQIVLNLILNAVDATRERGGEIVLTTGLMFADRAMLSNCSAGAGLAQGEYIFIEVSDNGVGMAPDIKDKIFDPFFTTKSSGRGLGLAAALGIVRGHRGALCVQSAPGAGAKFRMLLPPATKAASPVRAADAPASRPKRKTVELLMIEDEEQVRTVTVEMLKLFGYAVTAAPDGHSGVALYRENPGRFDLVLLDLIMPGLSGAQTLATLRILNPDVRVLLMSGYGEGDTLGRLGGGPTLGFLSKPFSRESLEKELHALLG